MDVVYNHTYMWENSAFTAIYPDYYYRQNYGGGDNCTFHFLFYF